MICNAEESFSPICDFLKEYTASGIARMHMPGHKGRVPASYPDFLKEAAPFDLTEVAGADALYEAEGIIGRSEDLTAALYGADVTCYSAGGSTLSILTMVATAVSRCGGRILAARNAHVAFTNACALTGAEPAWIFPEYDRKTGLCLPVTPEQAAAAMDAEPDAKIFYLTSPDYYGVIADLAGIAAEVHKRGGILIVDSAHGSHLPFAPGQGHPIGLGADLACDSPHKTLPVLTGGSLLHSRLPGVTKAQLKAAMALFGSTSPSYLIMASLDACQKWLREKGKTAFAALDRRVRETEQQLREQGVTLLERKTDCTKITVDCQQMGYTSDEIAAVLRKNGVEPEFSGGGKVVLMVSPLTPDEDFVRLTRALCLQKRDPVPYPEAEIHPNRVLSVREAVFSPAEEVPTDKSAGRIAAVSQISCPPGIPVVAAGEQIGENEKKLLKNSGIFSVFVVK